MVSPHDKVQAKLRDLRAAFIEQLPGKVRQIEDACAELRQGDWDPRKAEGLAQLLHTLAGTAGTFGFSEMRTAAKGLESELRTIVSEGRTPDVGALASVGDKISALNNHSIVSGRSDLSGQRVIHSVPSRTPSVARGNNTVFFVEDGLPSPESLAPQIHYYGYQVVTFKTISIMRDALKTTTPLLIIIDMSYSGGGTLDADTVAELQQGRETRIPVVFLSGRSDFDARLEAVRAGGDAYFTKPVSVGRLVDRIDTLAEKRPHESYRILIIDDEPLLADFHATVLQQAGMTIAVVTDPLEVLKSMSDFRPDLILMDVYMPGCSGMELARVIRQDESFIDIPIVFLSSETDINRQLTAMSRGGDDFLTKPIQPEHLIASVTYRADRHRALRSFMIFDGLTGLLNHTRTKEQLDSEVARAFRQKADLTFALIDIDHFKSVNDTHGHPVGDQVIKSLSRLLKQRLRTTDIVGRFGGEEFAIIFTDTDGQIAQRIMNELREDFSKIQHRGRGEVFSVTFSCGVASLTPGTSGSRLIDMADKALYEAKRMGRNQVVLVSL
jgi:diguanylate cyclase (GGDEF)-like protein